jgi:hypothetical protein
LEELEALEETLQTVKDQEGTLSTFAPPNVVQESRQQSEMAIKGLKPVCGGASEMHQALQVARIRESDAQGGLSWESSPSGRKSKNHFYSSTDDLIEVSIRLCGSFTERQD